MLTNTVGPKAHNSLLAFRLLRRRQLIPEAANTGGECVNKQPRKHPFPAWLYIFLVLGERNKDVLWVRETQHLLHRKALAK